MKRKINFLFLIGCTLALGINLSNAQNRTNSNNAEPKPFVTPKLVVGIVVDQMRYDYLTRFWNHYGEGGFKRLVNEGFNCKNNHFNYAPTSTGPGHASVYTGATPSTHGIIGNGWYDKENNASAYCAGDDTQTSVGTLSNAGKMSPHRMMVTTMTDQLRLHTQMRGKVIAVAIKDRGAVLPGGHTANAAYWFSGSHEGNWITSSYYMSELPRWVKKYNESRDVENYKKPWTTLKNIRTYVESGPDDNEYEGLFETEITPTFPHSTPNLLHKKADFEIIKSTPYGNSITTNFALEALKAEEMGKDEVTDFLAISYSSTDYIGHKYGVNSKEIQDAYLRLDLELEKLLKELDKEVGEGEYTLFLTSDHGAINVPAYLEDQKIPAGYFVRSLYFPKFREFLKFKYGSAELVKNTSNNQIFLDHKAIQNLELGIKEVQESLAEELLSYDIYDKVYTAYQMQQNEYTHGIPYILQNGYNPNRSGDILMVLNPGFIEYPKTGSTHGSPQIYDTHVPLLFYGKGIRKGSSVARTEIPDIAPTISALLGMAFPSGASGTPIEMVLE
ncbi:alkaline phosphatase PafA [Muriicola sp. Z0-33]|uniref:alkaline phosphatase PafA n=1 Tax=Muriicola sp. Z0-33 TaxID=2816957 RepID=UPI0022387C4E|nr:alkaline phosphatase PafA [Muriicola sp. Z0-33]MCW5516748.1 alkaline phosphatase family protein [Muriicola sp. Z0-33]